MLRPLLALALLAAVPAATPAPGAAAAATSAPDPTGDRAGAAAIVATRTVHLVTGDTVQVLRRADGSTATRIVAGPHANGPVARWQTATASYLEPRTTPALRAKLDPSLFDTTRLAQLPAGHVPVVVTLRPGAPVDARRATGDALHLDRSSARSSGRTARGWYDERGLDPRDLAAVSRLRLPRSSASPSAPAPDGPTHELTVQVHDGSGDPADFAIVFVLRVDADEDTYLETPSVDRHGTATLEVPEGNYAVMAWTFDDLVIAPETAVAADQTVALDLSAATVRPHVSVPGFRQVEAVLSVGRSPDQEQGYGFPLEFSGSKFFTKVQPTSGDVPHGSLHTGVSAKFVPRGSGPVSRADRLAVTADVAAGVPDGLDFAHPRSDFARVVQSIYANGPKGRRQTTVDASRRYVELFTGHDFPAPVPGRRTLLLQASDETYYQQTVFPHARPGSFEIAQLITVQHYPRSGATYRSDFVHGPVGPGSERGPWYGVRRQGDRLAGDLPLFSGAGPTAEMFSVVAPEDGHWSLWHDGRRIDRGTGRIAFAQRAPATRSAYVLRAVSHPAEDDWYLSSRVQDVWRFHSRRGQARPPLVTPSYVPPTTLAGVVPPGRTSFGLSFLTPRPTRIGHVAFEVSSDGGEHWRPAHLARTGPETFRVRYRTPPAADGRSTMSLRVSGRDRGGNAVTETAMDVYRLR